MNIKIFTLKALCIALFIFPIASFSAPETGEIISKQGIINDDYYAVGGSVNMDADVSGDVAVLGGDLSIEHRVQGDVMAAGGTVSIRGEVLDDVRTAAGDIHINASIGDDLFAAGGRINITPNATINGDVTAAGGNIAMSGTVNKNLFIAGGNIRISGKVHGDVDLEGGEIEILDGAVIDGHLHYKSPDKANIHPGAKITGEITYEKRELEPAQKSYGIFFSVTMIFSGIALFLLFPGFTMSSAGRINSEPLKSLGLGFAVFVSVPAAAILFISLVVSLWIGLILLALYFAALPVGLLISFFFIADWSAKLLHKDISSRGRRISALAITIILLGFIQMIPVIGGLISCVLLLLGLGAGVLQLYSVYTQSR